MNTACKDEEERKNNVLPFRLATAGDPPGPGVDWLKDLPVNTVFLCRKRPQGMNKDVVLTQFQVLFQAQKSACLFLETAKEKVWFHTKDFSFAHELVEVVFDPTIQQEETDNAEHSDRPDPQGGMECSVDGQGDH